MHALSAILNRLQQIPGNEVDLTLRKTWSCKWLVNHDGSLRPREICGGVVLTKPPFRSPCESIHYRPRYGCFNNSPLLSFFRVRKLWGMRGPANISEDPNAILRSYYLIILLSCVKIWISLHREIGHLSKNRFKIKFYNTPNTFRRKWLYWFICLDIDLLLI